MNREEFNKAFFDFCKEAMACLGKARREGLLLLEDDLDAKNEQYLKREIGRAHV